MQQLRSILIFIIAHQASFALANFELTPSIQTALENSVHFGECQAEFITEVEMIDLQPISDSTHNIVFVPCAQWAHNLRWMAFLVIFDENDSENVVFQKPLYFTHYSQAMGPQSTNYIENFNWDPEHKQLMSRKYLNGHAHCGEMALYEYNINLQEFVVKQIIKNDNCEDPSAKWQPFFNSGI